MTGRETDTGFYVLVFVILLALTGLTVGMSFVDMGIFNLPVALAIAGCKATLVLLYFMHLRDGPGLDRLALLGGLFWLGILLALSLSDVTTRGWL